MNWEYFRLHRNEFVVGKEKKDVNLFDHIQSKGNVSSANS